MSVLYAGVEMRHVQRIAQALAASPCFRGIVAAADASAARARIVEIAGPAPATAYALIGTPRFPVTRTPGGAFLGTIDVEVAVTHPPLAGLTEAELLRQAWNDLSEIRRDLLAGIGLQVLSCEPQDPLILDASDSGPGWLDWGYDLRIQAQA